MRNEYCIKDDINRMRLSVNVWNIEIINIMIALLS